MNKKKIIYIILGVVAAVFLLYHSVYFMSLTERMEQLKGQIFDPSQAIETFWKEAPEKLSEQAIDIASFDALLSENPQELAEKHGRTLGIGAPYSILIKGTAEIAEIKDEVVKLHWDSKVNYGIRIGSIFSNTMREASGYFDLDKFETTMDFNLVAIEINKRIVDEVTTPLVGELAPGVKVEFVGATDLNLRKLPVTSFDIIPIKLNIVK